MNYAELQVTTAFSFLRGASHAHELAAQAADLGHHAIAVTDRNTLAGAVRLHQAAKQAGLRPVIGARLDFIDAPSVLTYPTDRAAYGRLSRMLTIGKTITAALTPDPAALQLKRFPNSVDTLAPNNRFVIAINKIPIVPGIPYHSIVGDRGRGDTPNSSDSVVAYWSSHLPGAVSERIVPSNHSTPRNPEAIEEVHRILRLNARSH